jgi:hypothetical protein
MLTSPDLDAETVKLFFSMALSETDVFFIPNHPAFEYSQARKGLAYLAHHFGFLELAHELEKYFSPQSERFLDTFCRLVSPTDLILKRFDEAVLSDDLDDLLRKRVVKPARSNCDSPKRVNSICDPSRSANPIATSLASDLIIRVRSILTAILPLDATPQSEVVLDHPAFGSCEPPQN